MNLLKETLKVLKDNGKNYSEVEWVGTDSETFDKLEFLNIAASIDYDDSYGTQEILPQLVIVGNDWWLSREEYDGSEWWQFYTKPTKPGVQSSISKTKIRVDQ